MRRDRRYAAGSSLCGEKAHLAVAAGFGLISYLSQAKGYPYQRYPLLAFLLILMSMDFVSALRETGVLRFLGFAALAFGGFFLAPASAAMASRYDWRNLGTVGAIQTDLEGLGAARLAGGVQCVDSISGCTNALYRMRLGEVSSVFYDEFLFGPESVRAIRENRQKFWDDLQRSPPQVIVVTDTLFPSGPNEYRKLAEWPLFNDYLAREYSIYIERAAIRPVKWWSRTETPPGYRIYIRKPSTTLQ